ncbi:38197_t:CDS:2, partial [Gigaspora margarita]
MSQNKDRSATVEDEPLSSANSDVEPTHESGKPILKAILAIDWVFKMKIVEQLVDYWGNVDIDKFASHLIQKRRDSTACTSVQGSKGKIVLPPPKKIIWPGPSGCLEHCNKQEIVVKSDSNRLVQGYLVHAEYLVENSISEPYRKRLGKAWKALV